MCRPHYPRVALSLFGTVLGTAPFPHGTLLGAVPCPQDRSMEPRPMSPETIHGTVRCPQDWSTKSSHHHNTARRRNRSTSLGTAVQTVYHVPKTGGRNRPNFPGTVLGTVPEPGKQVRSPTPTRPIPVISWTDAPSFFFFP
ncbi:unnamed protein product [Ectocarpus sp. 6 AP-2014]